MPKQLILLAGLHKTATSSVQATCGFNARLLLQAGFVYPVVQGDPKSGGNHTRFLKKLFKTDANRGGLLGQFALDGAPMSGAEREQRRAEFAKLLRRADRIILAAEGVSTFSVDELAGLREWLEQQGFEIRVLCNVRHLSSWVNSMAAQRVISAYYLSIGQAVEEFAAHGSVVRQRIENLRQVFPGAEFCSHERAVLHRQGPVGHFLESIGYEPPPDFRFMRAKIGMSDCATRVHSLLNEAFGPYDAGNEAGLKRVQKIEGRKFTLRPQEVAPILPMLRAENEWLRETLGGEFHDPHLSFDEAKCEWVDKNLGQLREALAALPESMRSWLVSHVDRLDLERLP